MIYDEFEGEYCLVLIEDRYYVIDSKYGEVICFTSIWTSRWSNHPIVGSRLDDIECDYGYPDANTEWYLY